MTRLPIIIRPPIFALLLIIISIILHFTYPLKTIIFPPYNLFGITALIVGLWISLKGKNTFQKLGAPLIPGQKPILIVKEGLYNLTRNPMYLGFIISLLGIAIILGSISAFISPLFFYIIINFFFIPFEERLMENNFGQDFLDFKKQIRRWF